MSRLLLLAAALVCSTSSLPAAERTPKVLLIGIDGCRPDALQLAATPHLDRLVAEGMWFDGTDIRKPDATDEADTISGPGWSNILTGVWPDKHGVLDNKFTAPRYDRYPHIFVRVKAARPELQTASFSTWKPIADRIVQGADVNQNFSDQPVHYERWDAEATAACVRHLAESNPDFVVFYQGQVDETGHAHGFHPRVPEYLAAIERVDHNIGAVLAAVEQRTSFGDEDWLILVGTDHGGKGTNHSGGRMEPDIRRTFLIVSGPAAERGRSEAPTWQVDLAATALAHLRIKPLPDWELDGRSVGLRAVSSER